MAGFLRPMAGSFTCRKNNKQTNENLQEDQGGLKSCRMPGKVNAFEHMKDENSVQNWDYLYLNLQT